MHSPFQNSPGVPAPARATARTLALATTLLASASLDMVGALAATPQAGTIIKSPADPREYRHLTLDNGLRVVVVSDPQADKAAASLRVAVGHLDNPPEHEGLAHYLEHMLFLGTEKYPKPDEYKNFLSEHGGHDNAFTTTDNTNYFFEVDHRHLEGALDRFAQFFIGPLFNPEFVGREREVVHSEFLGGTKSDGRREYSVRQATYNPHHPASRFAVGNNTTLRDREALSIRQVLLDFFERHYSANRMTLAIVGRDPLATLEAWARKHFNAIENRQVTETKIEVPLYAPDSLPARVETVPERERYRLALSFPIPPVQPHWRSKPVEHIGHLLGHEGEGSLLALLKQRGWANGLSAGTGFDHASVATFDVGIELTPAGAEHIDEVVGLTFRMIDLIRDRGVQGWIFEESARLAELNFRFQKKVTGSSLAIRLASSLAEFPPAEILRAPYAHDRYDPELIQSFLARLVPENMLMTVVRPDASTDKKTAWYEAPYSVQPVSVGRVEIWWAEVRPDGLALPEPNPFIPASLDVHARSGPDAPPQRLLARDGFALWYAQDREFLEPRADFYFSIRSPVANDSAKHAVMTALLVELVRDGLNPTAYSASLAGLDFEIYPHMRGLSVRISGFNDRQHVLLDRILSALAARTLEADRFEIARERMARALKNAAKRPPLRRAVRELRTLVTDPSWSVDERLAAIATVTLPELKAFASELLARIDVIALAHGNLTREGATALADRVLASVVAPAGHVPVPRARIVQLAASDDLKRRLGVPHPESASVHYLQGQEKSFRARAGIALLAQALGAPFFDELRTRRKLGYVAFANNMNLLEVPALILGIQSPTANPNELDRHIGEFVDLYRATLQAMTPEEFERHRDSFLSNLLEKETRLTERSDRYWREIDRRQFTFDSRERIADAVRGLDLDQLRAIYDELLLAPGRRRLIVQSWGEAAGRENATGGVDELEQVFSTARGRFPDQ